MASIGIISESHLLPAYDSVLKLIVLKTVLVVFWQDVNISMILSMNLIFPGLSLEPGDLEKKRFLYERKNVDLLSFPPPNPTLKVNL